jgi:hypothetical protein
MVCVLGDLHPLPLSFLPDYYLSIVGGTGEDVAELGVCPGDLPNGAVVPVVRSYY